MQDISRRANANTDASANTNVKSVAEIEDVIPDFLGKDVERLRRGPKGTTDLAEANSLVQRRTSLSELRSVIGELQQLHDFLQNEGELLQKYISEYAELNKSAMRTTRLIADNLLHWKKPTLEPDDEAVWRLDGWGSSARQIE